MDVYLGNVSVWVRVCACVRVVSVRRIFRDLLIRDLRMRCL